MTNLGNYMGARLMTKWSIALLVYGAESSPEYDFERSFDGSLSECLGKLNDFQKVINDNDLDAYLTLEDWNGNYSFEGDTADYILEELEEEGLILPLEECED